MATDIKGLTIASTYQDLEKRDSGTYSKTGMNIEIQNAAIRFGDCGVFRDW